MSGTYLTPLLLGRWLDEEIGVTHEGGEEDRPTDAARDRSQKEETE